MFGCVIVVVDCVVPVFALAVMRDIDSVIVFLYNFVIPDEKIFSAIVAVIETEIGVIVSPSVMRFDVFGDYFTGIEINDGIVIVA